MTQLVFSFLERPCQVNGQSVGVGGHNSPMVPRLPTCLQAGSAAPIVGLMVVEKMSLPLLQRESLDPSIELILHSCDDSVFEPWGPSRPSAGQLNSLFHSEFISSSFS